MNVKPEPPSKEEEFKYVLLGKGSSNFLLEYSPWASSFRPCISSKEVVKGQQISHPQIKISALTS